MVVEINAERIGWHFAPTDQNLIKISRKWMQGDRFPELREVQFLDFEPHQLPELSVLGSNNMWFFLVRHYMDTEICTCASGGGSWRLFDQTSVSKEDGFYSIGMKRHYLFYDPEDTPTVWVAYEYRPLLSRQDQKLNDAEHAVIRLFKNERIDPNAHSYYTDQDIVNMLAKRNKGQEFPEFGIVGFFSKEPYQLAALESGERRIYTVNFHDVYSVLWATPKGKWKTVDNYPEVTNINGKDGGETVGRKIRRKYYDHEDKPTVWIMERYYTADQAYSGTGTEYYAVVLFKSDSDNSAAPEKGPDHIASPQSGHRESSDGSNPMTE